MSDGEWFEAKRYGYGAGLPISWQGWAVTALFLAVVIGSAFTLGEMPIATLALVVPATVSFVVICARTTRSGWRWRWGDKD